MSDTPADVPDRPGVAGLVEALNVERNAKVGFGLGVAFAALVFVWFVYIPDRQHSPLLWASLAFVLAVGTGLLLTLLFTLGSAWRQAKEL